MLKLRKVKPLPVLSQKDINYFWSNVNIGHEDSCWNYTYPTMRILIKGKQYLASRISYQIANGDYDPRSQIRNICGNKLCVNPLHLKLIAPLKKVDHNELPVKTKKSSFSNDLTKDQIKRFWSNVDVPSDDSCWTWILPDYRCYRLHKYLSLSPKRISYQLFYGNLDDNITLTTTCSNPKCVNPTHLKKKYVKPGFDVVTNESKPFGVKRSFYPSNMFFCIEGVSRDKFGFNEITISLRHVLGIGSRSGSGFSDPVKLTDRPLRY